METLIPNGEREQVVKLIAAARARAEGAWRGEDQRTIAKRLGISEVELSRLLAKARQKGYLRLEYHWDGVPRDIQEEAELAYFRMEEVASNIISFAGRTEHQFTNAVADFLCRGFNERAQDVGVMLGRTLHLLYERLLEIRGLVRIKQNTKLRFVPVVGDPVHTMHLGATRYSSSFLAAAFKEVLIGNDRPSRDPSLAGVPAYISASTRNQKLELPDALKRFIHETPGYRRIFLGDTESALIKEIDTLVTGVGTIYLDDEERTGVFLRELKVQEKISLAELQDIVVCDIGGILVPQENLSEAQRNQFRLFEAGFTGIKREHLERICKNAERKKSLGVIVVAYDETKLDGLLRLNESGLVSKFLISEALARKWREVKVASKAQLV